MWVYVDRLLQRIIIAYSTTSDAPAICLSCFLTNAIHCRPLIVSLTNHRSSAVSERLYLSRSYNICRTIPYPLRPLALSLYQSVSHANNPLYVYCRSRGMELGLYTTPGNFTCSGEAGGGERGSYGHTVTDANLWVEGWGIRYLKDCVCNTTKELRRHACVA